MGADMVMKGVTERYDGAVNLAYLCTPTDAFTIPKDAYLLRPMHTQRKSALLGITGEKGLGFTTCACFSVASGPESCCC